MGLSEHEPWWGGGEEGGELAVIREGGINGRMGVGWGGGSPLFNDVG